MRRRGLLLLGMLAGVRGAAQVVATPSPIPFVLAEDAGIRPLVAITVDGVAMHAVIHANASSYLQLNHRQAAETKLSGIVHRDSFGIAKPGIVSSLGRDAGTADTLQVGEVTDKLVPVDIFEKYNPAGEDIPMLGLAWIGAHRLVIDFAQRCLYLDPAATFTERLAERLRSTGYTAHKLYVDPADKRFVVPVMVGGSRAMLVVGTVAATKLDQGLAAGAHLATRRIGSFGGPRGATGTVSRTVAPVALTFDGDPVRPMQFDVTDTYAYSTSKRPAGRGMARGGQLGSDFLVATQAVIDFGNGVLYLR